MRDDQIMRFQEISARRAMMLFDQFQFLNTRMMAMEWVLFNRRMLWRALWNPQWARNVIDNRQKDLLSHAKAKLEKAKASPVIKPVVLGGNGNGKF